MLCGSQHMVYSLGPVPWMGQEEKELFQKHGNMLPSWGAHQALRMNKKVRPLIAELAHVA